jgi:hypothetical protein
VGVALASESAVITEIGVQFDCVITDYLAKDKPTDVPITFFHPNGSRFTNQTTTVRRGSSVFFSGALTFIEDKLYLELHNFTFLRGQQPSSLSTSIKQMPWSNSLKTLSSTKTTNPSTVQAIHKKSQQTPIQLKNTTTRSFHKIQQSSEANTQDIHDKTSTSSIIQTNDELPSSPSSASITSEIIQQQTSQQPTPKFTPKSTKRKTRSTVKTSKKPKLADLASNALALENDQPDNDID